MLLLLILANMKERQVSKTAHNFRTQPYADSFFHYQKEHVSYVTTISKISPFFIIALSKCKSMFI